jgi:putative transcriptional regulator
MPMLYSVEVFSMAVFVPTKWKLAELMARHRISNKELAAYLDMRPNSITDLKRAESMPRINGEQLDRIAAAVTALSKIGESIKGIDLLEDRE